MFLLSPRITATFCGTVCLCLLTACGQTGALYLPKDKPTINSKIPANELTNEPAANKDAPIEPNTHNQQGVPTL